MSRAEPGRGPLGPPRSAAHLESHEEAAACPSVLKYFFLINKSYWWVCYLPQWLLFLNERHTNSLYVLYALNNKIAGPLPNFHAANLPPANNPVIAY